MRSRLFAVITRTLRFFPAVLLAFALFASGLAVRDFFFQAADQLVVVTSTIANGGQ